MDVHPRISVNSLSSLYQPLSADVDLWAELGVDHVGLISPKLAADGWEDSARVIAGAGLKVSNVSTENHVIEESLRFASSVGARTVYACSGPAGSSTWEEAAAGFCEQMAPLAALAHELGVVLAVEPTNPLRGDVSFVYTLRDALDLARSADIGVVLDFYSCWYERGIEELVRKNVESIGLVQICDYAFGTFDTPNRVAIGDGDVPVARLLSLLVDAGYQGAFDLEILGPQIEAEGYRPTISRSLERATRILDELKA